MENQDISQQQFSPYGQCNPLPYQPTTMSPATPMSPYTSSAIPATPVSPYMPGASTPSIYPPMQQGPPPVMDVDYIPGFLASMIGKNVKAEFIVGSSQYVEKTGKLVRVGVNFFVLQDINSRTNIMCDLYSVRFVTILYA